MSIQPTSYTPLFPFDSLYQAAQQELVTSGEHGIDNSKSSHPRLYTNENESPILPMSISTLKRLRSSKLIDALRPYPTKYYNQFTEESQSSNESSQILSQPQNSLRGRPGHEPRVVIDLTRFIMTRFSKYTSEADWGTLKNDATDAGLTWIPRNGLKRSVLHIQNCKAVPQALRADAVAFIYYFTKGMNNSQFKPNKSCPCCKGKPAALIDEDTSANQSEQRLAASYVTPDLAKDESAKEVYVENRAEVLEPFFIPQDQSNDPPKLELSHSQEMLNAIHQAFSTRIFKAGIFGNGFLNRQLFCVAINKTTFNRQYLNEGAPALTNPTKIHVTLDRPALASYSVTSFSILLCATNTTLAKICVDLTTKTFKNIPWADFPEIGRLFIDNVFQTPPQAEAMASHKKTTYLSDEIIYCQFNWPFRQKKELNKWKVQIESKHGKAAMHNVLEIDKTGLQVLIVTGEGDEQKCLDSWIIPFSKSKLLQK